jgi:hypothetical protein
LRMAASFLGQPSESQQTLHVKIFKGHYTSAAIPWNR